MNKFLQKCGFLINFIIFSCALFYGSSFFVGMYFFIKNNSLHININHVLLWIFFVFLGVKFNVFLKKPKNIFIFFIFLLICSVFNVLISAFFVFIQEILWWFLSCTLSLIFCLTMNTLTVQHKDMV